jgi:hypothetical protein
VRALRTLRVPGLAIWLVIVASACTEFNPPTPQPVQHFSGAGDQVTPLFLLTPGLAVVRMTHSGSSNFIVWLKDEAATPIELLANEIGPYDGSTSVGIEAASWYLLDIDADGDWAVVVEQLAD